MKILFVTRGFPSDKDPMSGNYEAVQAKAIAAKGHEVVVVSVKFRNLLHIFQNWKIHYRMVDGVHIYECNRMNLYYPFHTPKVDIYAKRWQFKRVFSKVVNERGMPDVVHAHLIQHAVYAAIVKDVFRLPFVITEHWTRMNTEHIPQVTMRKMFVYQDADRVICVSDALAKNLKRMCNVQSVVIHNMVSDQFFKSLKIDRHDAAFRFIAVGALRRNKRFDILIESFALCSFPEEVTLSIVGEGEEREIIENKIRENNLGKQVKLLGVKTPEEVNSLLCQSDCFVLSSRLETFAIVVIEAMAKGLPVIATKSGGPETFVRQEDGLLVEKENAEDLARAMKYMTEHYTDYNGEEIRRYCYDNFSQDVIANMIIDVYKQVIKK